MSAFHAMNTDDPSTGNGVGPSRLTAETVLESGSDDRQDDVDLGRNVRMNLSTRLLNASDDADSTHASDVRDLVMDAKDQGQPNSPNFPTVIGALGNGSGVPLDGTQNVSFGANDGRELTAVGDENGGHNANN